MFSQAEREAVARESWARHSPNMIATIKEIRATLDIGLYEAKDLYLIALDPTLTQVPSSKLELARKVLSVHGLEHAAKELAPRLDCSPDEAQSLVRLVSPDTSRVSTSPHYEWNSGSAEKWLRKYAAHLAREAKYIRENANGFACNEDEFRCGLANGLGIDDEKEQDEIISEIHNPKESKKQ